MIIKQIELAKLVGCSRQAIYDLKKKKKIIFNKDGLFDSKEDVNKNFLLSKNINPKNGKPLPGRTESDKTEKAIKKKKVAPAKKEKNESQIEYTADQSDSMNFEEISGLPESYRKMTVEAIVMKFGTMQNFKIHVEIVNKVLASMKMDVDIKEKRKELVPRAFIEYLKIFIDDLMNKLFDYADSFVIEIIPIVKTDEEKAKIKIPEIMRKNISKYGKETQRNIKRQVLKLEREKENI
jgi:hypothetical protein